MESRDQGKKDSSTDSRSGSVTPEELLASIEGTANEETRRKIVAELNDPQSSLRRLLKAMESLTREGTSVDGLNWAKKIDEEGTRGAFPQGR